MFSKLMEAEMQTTPIESVHEAISPIADILEEARQGRPIIIVDAEDRENEGDIIIPADFASPEIISFMAVHARGLVCLSLTQERSSTLRLQPMTHDNRTANRTAFMVSIEAKEGITTGISAHDRARTIAAAVSSLATEDDLVTPGHVFPLVARDGGVLVRAGHTEAAVDIARLAGLTPAGVICEIMNDDGTMSRLPELIKFAKKHALKIGTISDLIAYRRRTESQVEKVYEGPFSSLNGGEFVAHVFRNAIDGTEHIALTRGTININGPTMVRMHQVDMAADILAHVDARRNYVPTAMQAIGTFDGPGVIVFIRDPDSNSLSERFRGIAKPEARSMALRDYGVGAQILRELGVRDMILLTSSKLKPAALEGYDLSIVERRPIDEAVSNAGI